MSGKGPSTQAELRAEAEKHPECESILTSIAVYENRIHQALPAAKAFLDSIPNMLDPKMNDWNIPMFSKAPMEEMIKITTAMGVISELYIQIVKILNDKGVKTNY